MSLNHVFISEDDRQTPNYFIIIEDRNTYKDNTFLDEVNQIAFDFFFRKFL